MSKARSASLRMAAISKVSPSKRPKPKKSKSAQDLIEWQANICSELSSVQFKLAQLSDRTRTNQQQLTSIVSELNKMTSALYDVGTLLAKTFETSLVV